MYTISNMIAIFVDLAAFQMPMALMFYLIVWFATNKKDATKTPSMCHHPLIFIF